MAVAAELLVEIGTKTDKAERGFGRVSTLLQKFGDTASSVGSALMDRVNIPITDVANALVNLGGKAIGVATDYQSAMAMLEATSGATGAQLAALGDQAKALGGDIALPGTSAGDAAEAMVELSKSGMNVNDIMGASKGVLQMAAAGHLSNAKAAEYAANALNTFGLSGDRATMVADLFAATANASSLEVGDMAEAFNMAAAVFSSFQGPVVGAEGAMVDLSASLAVLANNGIKGSDAGTALKQSLLQLSGPSDKAKGLMRELAGNIGMSGDIAYDASGKMRPFREILDLTARSTANMTDEQRQSYLTTIFGADAVRVILPLMGSLSLEAQGAGKSFDQMRTAVTKQGAAGKLAEAQMKGLRGAVEGFKSQLETTLLVAVEPFLPAMEAIVGVGTSVLGAIANLAPVFSALASGMSGLVGVIGDNLLPIFGALGAALTAFAIKSVAAAITSAGGLTAGFVALKLEAFGLAVALQATAGAALKSAGAMALAALPYVAIGAAIGVTILKFNEYFDKVEEAEQKTLNMARGFNDGTAALEKFNTAQSAWSGLTSETTAEAELQANIVRQLQDELREAVSAYYAVGGGTAENKARMIELNNALKTHSQQLNVATGHNTELGEAANKNKQAMLDSMMGVVAAKGGWEDYNTALELTPEMLAEVEKQLEAISEKGPQAMSAVINGQVDFQADLEARTAEHNATMASLDEELRNAKNQSQIDSINERIAAEQAAYQTEQANAIASYADQQAAQRAHLGQMLIDYINAKAVTDSAFREQSAGMISAISAQYGVQADVAQIAFGKSLDAVDNFVERGGGSLSSLMGILEGNTQAAVDTQQSMEGLQGEYVAKLTTNFLEGKINADQLVEGIERIPNQVDTDIKQNAKAAATEVSDYEMNSLAKVPKTIVTNLSVEKADAIQKAYAAGAEMAQGVAAGIAANALAAATAMGNLAFGAIQAGRNRVQARSPSKLAWDILGIPIGQGVMFGILSMKDSVAGALGDVVGRSISDEGAKKAAETVGAIVKTMGEAAAVLTQLRSFVGPSRDTLLNFSFAMRDATADFWHRMVEIDYAMNEATGEWAETTGAVMDTIGSGVEALSKLKDFVAPSRDSLLSFSYSLRDAVADFWHRGKEVEYALNETTTGFAEVAGKTVGVIGDGVDAFAKLREYEEPSRAALNSFVAALGDTVREFATEANDLMEVMQGEAAPLFVERAEAAVGVIAGGVEAFQKLGEYEEPSRAALNAFVAALGDTVAEFQSEANDLMEIMEGDAAPMFAERAGAAVGVIKDGVDAFIALQDFSGVPEGALASFGDALRRAIAMMISLSAQFDAEGVAAAAEFADSAGRVIAPIKDGVDAFSSLKEYEGVAPGVMELLFFDMRRAIDMMMATSQTANLEGVQAAAEFSDSVKQVFDGLSAGIGALSDLREYESVPQERMGAFQADFAAALTMIQALVGTAEQARSEGSRWRSALEAFAADIRAGVDAVAALNGLNVSFNASASASVSASGDAAPADGSHASGLWQVPNTGKGYYRANLHPREMVLPADAADQYRAEHNGYGQRRSQQEERQAGAPVIVYATVENELDIETLAYRVAEVMARRRM